MYSATIGAIVDKHEPLTTRTVTVRPHTRGIMTAYRHKSVLDVSWNEDGEQPDWNVTGWPIAFSASLSQHPYILQIGIPLESNRRCIW